MSDNFVQEKFLYTDDEVPLSIFENCVGIGNKDLYLHCHDCMELIYIGSGSGSVYVELTEFQVNAGDFILIAPSQLHSAHSNLHDTMFCKAVVIDLNALKDGKIDYIYKNFIHTLFDSRITPTLIQKQHSFYAELSHDFFVIFKEYSDKKEAYECFIKSYLYHLLGTLYRNSEKHSEFTSNSKYKHAKIKIALQYILEHFEHDITVDELAALTGYSKYYFMHFFKNVTGLTVTQYINMVRLDKAASLLLNSEYSITEISAKVGFNNLSYFIRQFTLRYQKTPKEFRK